MFLLYSQYLQNFNMERNPSNSSYIFLLYMNFENLTIELHILIISSILAKFQED